MQLRALSGWAHGHLQPSVAASPATAAALQSALRVLAAALTATAAAGTALAWWGGLRVPHSGHVWALVDPSYPRTTAAPALAALAEHQVGPAGRDTGPGYRAGTQPQRPEAVPAGRHRVCESGRKARRVGVLTSRQWRDVECRLEGSSMEGRWRGLAVDAGHAAALEPRKTRVPHTDERRAAHSRGSRADCTAEEVALNAQCARSRGSRVCAARRRRRRQDGKRWRGWRCAAGRARRTRVERSRTRDGRACCRLGWGGLGRS
jgi:hypothetical protein